MPRCAQDFTLSCDLFLAIGSSLVVWPAARFPCKIGNVVELGRLTVDDNQTGAVPLGNQIVRHPPMFTGCELLAAFCIFVLFPWMANVILNNLWAKPVRKPVVDKCGSLLTRALRQIRPQVQS
jgi:hypothetical protein